MKKGLLRSCLGQSWGYDDTKITTGHITREEKTQQSQFSWYNMVLIKSVISVNDVNASTVKYIHVHCIFKQTNRLWVRTRVP